MQRGPGHWIHSWSQLHCPRRLLEVTYTGRGGGRDPKESGGVVRGWGGGGAGDRRSGAHVIVRGRGGNRAAGHPRSSWQLGRRWEGRRKFAEEVFWWTYDLHMLFKVWKSLFFRGEPNTGAGNAIIKIRTQETHTKFEFYHLSCCLPSHALDFGGLPTSSRGTHTISRVPSEVSRLQPGQLDTASQKGALGQCVTMVPHQLGTEVQKSRSRARACHCAADPASDLSPPPVKQAAIVYKNTAHTGF